MFKLNQFSLAVLMKQIKRILYHPGRGRGQSRQKEKHIYNHNVTENEAKDIISRPGEDRLGREGSQVAIGQTQTGQYLRLIYVPNHDPDEISGQTG